MSLAQRIRKQGTREYEASDGTTYLLQRVNDPTRFLNKGYLEALKALAPDDGVEFKDLTEQEIMRRILANPGQASDALSAFTDGPYRTLERGLVGERNADGSLLRYTWSDKPLADLNAEAGEINARFVPPDLLRELVAQIEALGKPAVEARAVSTFPAERPSDPDGSPGSGDGHAPQRGPLGI